jgi:histone acetyltransferase 1
MTTMDEQQEAKRRKLEALEAKMGGAPPPQATRPAKMPELPALKPTQPTPAEAAPPTTDASEEEARSPFVCDANDVVQFRLVRTEADMDAAEVFEPEFTHQIFRDDETIFGYRDLVVKISMSANLFKTLVEISYAEKVKSVLNPADDITAMLKRHLGDDVFTDRAAFIATLKADASAPVPSAGGNDRVHVGDRRRRRRDVRGHRARVQALRRRRLPVARAVRAHDLVLHRRRVRHRQRGYQVAPLRRHESPSG